MTDKKNGKKNASIDGKALTANTLTTGLVVFLTRTGFWTPDINEACIAEEELAWTALERKGDEDRLANIIVEPYLIDIENTDEGPRPVHIRERIRTLGPSVRTDLGKQAVGIGGSAGPLENKDA